MSPDIKWDLSLIGALLVLSIIIVMLVRDIQMIRRREPIKNWLSGAIIYPDDPAYWYYASSQLAPYAVFVLLALALGLFAIWVAIWPPQPSL